MIGLLLLLGAPGPTGDPGPRGTDAPWIGLQCAPTGFITGVTPAGPQCTAVESLSMPVITRRGSIPVPAFHARSLYATMVISTNYAFAADESLERLYAGVPLPSGAILRSLGCVVEDNNAGLELRLYVRPHSAGTTGAACSGPDDSVDSPSLQVLNATGIAGCNTPAGATAYSVELAPNGSVGASPAMRLLGCYYTYEITSVLP